MAETNTYRAVVISNTLQHSKNKGTPSVKIKVRTKFDITRPDIAINYTIYGDLWLTFKTIEKTLKTLEEVFEWKGKFIEDFNQPVLVGKECDVVVEEDFYEEKPTFSIKFFNRVGGLKIMESQELQDLVESVQPMINSARGITPDLEEVIKKTEPETKESEDVLEPGPVVEDDLPF